MTRRQKDIVLLLRSILDAPFAQPKSWTSELVRKNAVRGEVPATRVPCPACLGERRRRLRTVVVDCDRCLGAKGRPLGYIVVDGMIDERYRRRIGTIETGIEQELKTVPCDVCGGAGRTLLRRWRGERDRCERCFGGGRLEVLKSAWRATRTLMVEVEICQPIGDQVVASMDARAKAGSYDELDAALQELRAAWPALYRLVLDVYVRGEQVGERLRRLAFDGGLAFIEARMPEEIRVPGHLKRRELAA